MPGELHEVSFRIGELTAALQATNTHVDRNHEMVIEKLDILINSQEADKIRLAALEESAADYKKTKKAATKALLTTGGAGFVFGGGTAASPAMGKLGALLMALLGGG